MIKPVTELQQPVLAQSIYNTGLKMSLPGNPSVKKG